MTKADKEHILRGEGRDGIFGGSEYAVMERKLVSLSDGQHFMRSIPVPRDDYGLGYVTRGILVGRGVITMLDAYATASVFGGKNDD